MEIKELGEFGLIDRLTKNIQPINSSTIMGVGDDAAVLNYSNKETLVSSQMFMEGVQFDLTYIDMEHLAYKVAMIAMSNIFAMNGQPRQIIVSLGLGKRFKVEDIEQFYAGLNKACTKVACHTDKVGLICTTAISDIFFSCFTNTSYVDSKSCV